MDTRRLEGEDLASRQRHDARRADRDTTPLAGGGAVSEPAPHTHGGPGRGGRGLGAELASISQAPWGPWGGGRPFLKHKILLRTIS